MRRKIAVLALLLGTVTLGLASPAAADDAFLTANLTGAAERPGPGDPDGTGTAYILIDDSQNQICLFLVFARVTLPTTGLHIHEGSPSESGPVVVPFDPPTTNFTVQCKTADEVTLDRIAAHPGAYYLNLHTQPHYGAGAIRGQLRRLA